MGDEDVDKNVESVKCDQCGIIFQSVIDHQIHTEESHAKKPLELFDSAKFTKDGEQIVDVEKKAVRKYPCIVCKKKFGLKKEMKMHVRSVHFAHVVLCNECGRRVKQSELESHMQMEHLG